MNEIDLSNLKLKTFTEQDALDCCKINNINADDIIQLNLNNNKLTDISGIRLFKNLKNLKYLHLYNNQIKNISVIQNFKNLGVLEIVNLELDSDQIKYIQSLKNLKELYCYKGFKDMSIINKLNKNIEISYIN